MFAIKVETNTKLYGNVRTLGLNDGQAFTLIDQILFCYFHRTRILFYNHIPGTYTSRR